MKTILKVERAVVQWLSRDFQRRTLRAAVRSAYGTFVKQHPQWSASFFDEYFVLTHLLPLLESAVSEQLVVTSYQVALLWAQQISALPAQRLQKTTVILPAATQFLAMVADVLAAGDHPMDILTVPYLRQGTLLASQGVAQPIL